jgi:hypothetical protein
MDELKWEMLIEVFGRLDAEAIKSLLEAQGIPVELFQEAVGHHVFPVMVDGLGKVQIFVPIEKINEALEWLAEYQNTNTEQQGEDD